jgi:hypothetical protein
MQFKEVCERACAIFNATSADVQIKIDKRDSYGPGDWWLTISSPGIAPQEARLFYLCPEDRQQFHSVIILSYPPEHEFTEKDVRQIASVGIIELVHEVREKVTRSELKV